MGFEQKSTLLKALCTYVINLTKSESDAVAAALPELVKSIVLLAEADV